MKKDKPTLKEYFYYYTNYLLTKGTIFKILLLLLSSIVVIAVLSIVLKLIYGESIFFFGWETLMHLLDTGVISNDDNKTGVYLVIMLIDTLIGVVLFSMLIGFITDGLSNRLSKINSGQYKIIEKNHIVIIGFNDEVYSMIKEIVDYNKEIIAAGKKPSPIIILDDKHSVEEMTSLVEAAIGKHKGTRIIYRQGNSFNPASIDMCSVDKARGVIINSQDDYQTIKWIIELSNVLSDDSDTKVTAVIKELKNVLAAEYAGGDNISILFLDDVIHHILSQSCKNTGISKAIGDLLNFKESQFVVYKNKLFDGHNLNDINNTYNTATVIGKISEDGTINMDSDVFEEAVLPSDSLIFLADNEYDVINESSGIDCIRSQNIQSIVPSNKIIDKKPKTVLILRFTRTMEMLVEEQFATLPEGSKVYVACPPKYDRMLKLLRLGYEDMGLEVLELNEISYYSFEALIDKCNPDKCIILSDNMESIHGKASSDKRNPLDLEKEDEDVMLSLLFIRDIAKRKGLSIDIIVELQKSSTNSLVATMPEAGDFVNVGQITSYIITQVVYDPRLKAVFKLLFAGGNYAIQMYDAINYFDANGKKEYDIRSLAMLLQTHHKTLIGMKMGDDLIINPDKRKKWIFNEEDKLIVLEAYL